jgi:FAD:protein FMN transferase
LQIVRISKPWARSNAGYFAGVSRVGSQVVAQVGEAGDRACGRDGGRERVGRRRRRVTAAMMAPHWLRRARPLLGTLVDIGVRASAGADAAAIAAAFDALRDAQDCLSRFEAGSDVARFHALPRGGSIELRPLARTVLAAAQELRDATHRAFDITLGTAPRGWRCAGTRLHKLDAAARLDLGGIGKGAAVDEAVQTLIDHGCSAGWVNAGGDLRAFGDVDVPVQVRDEASGGTRPFATLREGAFATSHYGTCSRSQMAAPRATTPLRGHISVAAPLCLWADALTKVVAISGDAAHPLLVRHGARAWLHT